MQDTNTANSESEARPIRVILEFSPDLREIRSVFPPGNSDEEDMRVLRLFQESFALGLRWRWDRYEQSAA
jgi:hypothetical protein